MGGELPASRWPAVPTVEAIGRVTRRLRGPRVKPARSRIQRLSRDDRRAQILGSALVAFARDGVVATTMDSIAATAGVSKPLVYQYFPNKRAALLAVVEHHTGSLLEALGTARAGAGAAGLGRQFTTYLDFARANRVAFQLLFRAVDGTDLAATERINAARRAIGDACVVAAVGATDGVPEWVGDALCALVEGVALRLDPDVEVGPLAHRLSRFVRLDHLQGPPGRPRTEDRAVALAAAATVGRGPGPEGSGPG